MPVEPMDLEQVSKGRTLFGTLDVEGYGNYYVYWSQKKTTKTWLLTDKEFPDISNKEEKKNHVVAILRSYNTGRLEGDGKTFILTQLMTHISSMVYLCINNSNIKKGFMMEAEYKNENTDSYISFKALPGGNMYQSLTMVHEGFRLILNPYRDSLPIPLPKLYPVADSKNKAAVVANLGIKTAASLFRALGSRLDWYKKKNYKLIDSNEKFQNMMSDFLDDVQRSANEGKAVLVGLDTETTGLNVRNLSPDNPLRDTVVSVPFAWKDNEGFVICTDMYYFDNVDGDEIWPLFTKLFSRNPDFTSQDIQLQYRGKYYSFNRKNIVVSGWNVMFDEQAFFTEGADIYFDEDGRQIFFCLDTDLLQGNAGKQKWGGYRISNSLKAQTRRMIGDETLELDELFGAGHEDKYRYLQDVELALIYGGADADYTRQVVKIGRSLLEKQLYLQYRNYDMPIAYMLAKASWNGMPIDTEKVRERGDLVSKDLERLKDFIYHYAWLANREALASKAEQLKDIFGLKDVDSLEESLDSDKMFRYPFTPANHKKLLFGMLGYPITKKNEKTGDPALDKFVLQKLMSKQRDNPVEVLTEDIYSLSDPKEKLVDKDKFNKDAFPLARVFSTYATLNKEYTSYYKPIIENDMEGRMFYNFTMAVAATRRILSPGQTMKGSLKTLCIAPPGKIFMSFDASQIEYRHMASLAYIRSKKLLQITDKENWEKKLNESSIATIHAMMQKEEADYHIETAAAMTGVKQHEVTPKVRKRYKSIGFGIPYGLGERSMCEALHGGVVNDETMKETKELLSSYYIKQKEIIDLLESARDSAFVPANIPALHKEYLGVGDSHVGIVRNFIGFYRVFILENLTKARVARIRRQAGNCLIQGGAAELFRRMLYNFHVGCCKYGIQDKVQWLMTVHDELDATIDADIDIMLLIKVLYENCTLRYEDHIPYYIGINFGANWYDAKADANELPVIMVQRMIDAYDKGEFSIPSDGKQAENLLLLKRHYMCDRVEEELKKIIPSLKKGHVWTDSEVETVDKLFENYVVRSYLGVFGSGDLKAQLTGWQSAREEYGFGISFLTETFEPKDITDIGELDFDLGDGLDLSIDLLSSEPSELQLGEEENEQWFGESDMFDQSISQEDMLVTDGAAYQFTSDKDEEEDPYYENSNPTNAYDVFLSKAYIRTKVLKVKDNVYSVLLAGTRYMQGMSALKDDIKSKFGTGNGTLMLIGSTVAKVTRIDCSEENLNWLDKLISNKEGV